MRHNKPHNEKAVGNDPPPVSPKPARDSEVDHVADQEALALDVVVQVRAGAAVPIAPETKLRAPWYWSFQRYSAYTVKPGATV
jgi:hypothetical protein